MALEAIGISVASDLAKDHTKDLLFTVKRQAGYFFCFSNIAKDLGTKKDKLVSKQQGLLKRAEDANNNTEQISDKAHKWLEEAKKHIEEANNLEAKTKEKRKCFLGWCPNCIWQYRLGRKMAKKIEEVVEHHENSELNYFSRLRTLPGIGYYSSKDFIDFQSRKLAYDKLLEALKDSQNFRIGLYGMGGLGKTTLVKEVGKEVMKSKSFDKVVFVVVSNPPDVRKIQEEIAESLRLEFKEQYESNRAQRLYMRLTDGEKILLILDDVWRELDFKAIGIPFDNSHQGYCGVLLTTRSAHICRSMNCQPKIDLQLLPKEDAWFLFKKHANITDETHPNRLQTVARDITEQCKGLPVAIAAVASTLKDQDLKVWEEALSTLKDSKPMDKIDEDLVEIYRCLKLSYDNLKNERTKELFLLCSLFPEDYEIPMEDLIRYAIGLGIFGYEDSYGTLRSQVCQTKNKLIDSCMLLNASSQRESMRMQDLIRDVAQLIAKKEIQVIMGEQKNLQTLFEDTIFKDSLRYLWLHVNKIDETPYLLSHHKLKIFNPLDWPNLEILVMFVDSKEHIEDVADTVFIGMEALQVLTLIGAPKFRSTKMRIPELINLQTLRLKNWVLGDICIVGNLKKLKTLELENCTITELPDGILELKKLRLLGLFKCSVGKNPFGVMERFSQLEELYFTKVGGRSKWKVDYESISKFFDEKCCLKKLKGYLIEVGDGCRLYGSMNYLNPRGLYIQRFDTSTSNATIKDLVQRAEILHLQDVQGGFKSITPDIVQAVGSSNELIELELDSCLEIECLLDTTNHSSEIVTIFSNLVKLRLKTMHNLKELCHGPSPSNFLQKLVKLDLVNCSKLQNILFVGNLNLCNLKSMRVSDCPTLTSLFTLSIAHNLELLETLTIRGCNGLKYIIADRRGTENEENIVPEKDEHYQKISDGSMFPKLKSIEIGFCDSLEWIFPVSVASGLEELEEIRVWEVAELKNIFGQYQHEDHPLHENVKEIILPSLRRMRFFEIPNFISIFPLYYHPSDQPLQSIDLELKLLTELEKSTYKSSDWVLPAATAACLSKQLLNLSLLGKIILSSIPKLVSLFKLSTAQEMLLEHLQITNCHELKHIIANEEEDHDDNNYDPVTVFPKLRRLVVRNCSILKMLLPVSLAHGLVQLESIELKEAPHLEYVFGGHDDHLSHQIENDIHIEFPALKELDLAELPMMISICSRNYYPTWPILKSLGLSKCPLLKISSIIDCIIKKDSEKSTYKNSDWVLPAAIAPCLSKQLLEIILSSIPKLVSLFKLSTAQEMLLEHLEITNCHELKHIIANEEEDHDDNNYDSVTVFPKLRRLVVRNCSTLKMLLPVSLAHGLVQLKSIELKEAPQLEYVFGGHDDHLSHQIENHIHIEFPALKRLDLGELPRMISICSRNYYPTWPILKSLGLSKCPLLKISSIIDCITKKGSREIVNEDNQSRIEVQALETMLNLEALCIDDDGELEGIFLLEGLPSSRQQTQLYSRLQRLELKDLPKLRHICKTPLLLSFQNLEFLIVHGCGKLSFVFSTCVLRDLPQLKELCIRDCDQLEQIIEDEEDHKVCFPALFRIEIQRCNKLDSLFSINTSSAFPKLRSLCIAEASQLEVIFTHEMCNVENNLMLPSLSYLRLVKLPSLVSVCHGFKLQSVKHLNVMDCPKLASTSTATAEAFPHEYQNADEKSMEANEKEEEENIMAVVDNSCSTETNVMSQDKGKQPAESVLTSNERKDPQTSTNHEEENHSEEEETREVRMPVAQSTTPSVDENSTLAETDNASLRSEDDYPEDDECKEAEVQEKEQRRKDQTSVAQTTATSIDDNSALAESNTAFNQDKVRAPSEIVLTNPYGGRERYCRSDDHK